MGNKSIFILIIFIQLSAFSQPGNYRYYPQTQMFYWKCEMKPPVKTIDNGYIFSFMPWLMNLHGIYPIDYYTIKTDSNFVPQWKKPIYTTAITLPTGGIIIFQFNKIEKITVSGTIIWSKEISDNSISINDGVSYTNKVRLVGSKIGNTGFPNYNPTSQPYTIELDTTGNLLSQSLYNLSSGGDADFSRIKKDALGNFYIFSSPGLNPTTMSIAKFNSNMALIWAKRWANNNQQLLVTDIDILPNGRIFATGEVVNNYPSLFMRMGALLKFDSQGNLVQQKYLDGSFRLNGSGNYNISGLCKKANNNYIISEERTYMDSIISLETDTSMNIAWCKLIARGTSVGTSLIKQSNIFTPFFKGANPVLMATNMSGVSCSSYNSAYSLLNCNIALTNFSLTPSVPGYSLLIASPITSLTQSYLDSCYCTVSVQGLQSAICTGNSTTVNVVGSSTISWYANAVGNSFLQSGAQYVYSSNIPTTAIIYAQDSTCTQNPVRTPVSIHVYPTPTLMLSVTNTTICPGNTATIQASGANNYSWSCNSLNTATQILSPAVTTNYTITGINNNICFDTKTISITVVPALSITSTPSIVCQGQQATITVSGASSYTWQNGSQNNNQVLYPTAGISNYSVIGQVGNCSAIANFSLYTGALPNVAIVNSNILICSNDTVVLFAIGAQTYTWSNSVISNSVSVLPNTNTSFTVMGSDSISCQNSASYSFQPVPSPTLSISSSNPMLCVGENVTITVSGATSYTWNNAASATNIILTPTTNILVSVIGENGFGCKSNANYLQMIDPCVQTKVLLSSNNHIMLYPNPTTGDFELMTDHIDFEVEITDILGSIQFKSKFFQPNHNRVPFHLSEFLNKGIYLFKLISNSSTEVIRLIVE